MEHEKIAHQQELRKVVKCKDHIIDDLKQTNIKLQGHVSQSSTGNVRAVHQHLIHDTLMGHENSGTK